MLGNVWEIRLYVCGGFFLGGMFQDVESLIRVKGAMGIRGLNVVCKECKFVGIFVKVEISW